MNPHLITFITVINFLLLNLCSAETAKNIKDIEFAKIKDHSLKLDLYLPEKNTEIITYRMDTWRRMAERAQRRTANWIG